MPQANDPTLAPPVPALDSPVTPGMQEAQQALMQLNERAMAYVRERPVACLLGAAALGYVVGKIASRY